MRMNTFQAECLSDRRCKWQRLIVCLALVISLSGCATAHRAREAQRDHALPAGERSATGGDVGIDSKTVLTIDRAVEVALSCHPSLVQATQAIVAAQARLDEARGAGRPSANASASFGRSTQNTADLPFSSKSRRSLGGSVQADFTLFDFGRTRAAMSRAEAAVAAAVENMKIDRRNIILAVKLAFFDLRKAQELLKVAEDSVRQYRDHLEQVRAFADVGRRPRYDLTKASVALGKAELDLVAASNAVFAARATLLQAMGLASDPGFSISNDLLPDIPQPDPTASPSPEHPELQEAHARVRQASAAVDAAIADLYPNFGLNARFNASGEAFPLVANLSAVVQAMLELLSGGRKTAALDASVAELRAARSQLAAKEQEIAAAVSRARTALAEASARLPLASLLVRQAQENLDIVTERYKVGAASLLEVTDAEAALTSARAETVRATFEQYAAIVRLRHALGEEP